MSIKIALINTERLGGRMENFYNGKMAIFKYQKRKLENKQTILEKNLIFDNIPCHLSSIISTRGKIRDIDSSQYINKVGQVKKVFLSPKYLVDIGSFISIIQDGKIYEFTYSGEAYIYSTHQEIYLENIQIA